MATGGLLDWVSSPAGIGLLSAVAGGMATAQRGTPWNNAGRGAMAGLTGYMGAKDQLRQDSDNAITKQYKQLQMAEIAQKLADNQAKLEWKAGLPNVMAPKLSGNTEQGMQLADQQAVFGHDGLQGLQESAQYAQPDAPLSMSYGPDKQAMQDYARLPGSPVADDLIKQQFVPKAPKWSVVERFNDQTGMPEKVLMDENNPSDIRSFGGAQADTIVADNLGGQTVYRGAHSAEPVGMVNRTVTPDAMLSNERMRSEGALNRGVTMRGQDISGENAAKKRAAEGWKYDAGSDEWVTPPSPQFPMGQRSGNKAKIDAGKSMSYVISQFRDSKDEKGNVVPGALDKATTGGPMGVYGMAGRVFDSQDAMRFNNLKEQMSTDLRTLFRIPGEGALSDMEQRQYGLQLPDVNYKKSTNEAILKDIESRVAIKNNLSANPHNKPKGNQGRTVAPQAAINDLRKNPSLAPQFKAKFGYLP